VIPDDELGDVLLNVQLNAGDLLYLPRGFPHYARATEEASLHVTLAMYVATWTDLVRWIASKSQSLRAAVRPRTGSGVSARQFYRMKILPALESSDELNALESLLAESLTNLPPLSGSRLESIADLDSVTPDTLLTRSQLVLAMVQLEDGCAVLRCPGARIVLHSSLLPMLEFIADSDSFRFSDVPGVTTENDRLDIARLLILHGLVNVSDAGESRNAFATG